MTEREFLAKYLPAGASCGHDVLYDWEGTFSDLTTNAALLSECVRDFLPMLRGATIVQDLYREGHDASELLLSLLARGQEENVPLPKGEVSQELIAEVNRLEAKPRSQSDALQRLWGIRELLSSAGPDPVG
jgi:hypothetical protein